MASPVSALFVSTHPSISEVRDLSEAFGGLSVRKPCRFDGKCNRPDCSYTHTTPTTKSPALTPVSQGHYPVAPVSQGHYPVAPVSQGHYPVAPMPQGHYPVAPMPQGHYPVPPMPQGHYPVAPMPRGHYPMAPVHQGHYSVAPMPQGHYPVAPVAYGYYPVSNSVPPLPMDEPKDIGYGVSKKSKFSKVKCRNGANCSRKDCAFNHKVCRDFLTSSGCDKTDCSFQHERKLCIHFHSTGKCSHGESCLFKH